MSTVCIKKAAAPYTSALERLLEPFANALALRGSSILIKPNLVEPESYSTGQTTNPALVEAIIMWCKTQGAKKIAVGEGPSYFQPASALRACFTATGMANIADRQAVPWILFDEGPFRQFRKIPRACPISSVSRNMLLHGTTSSMFRFRKRTTSPLFP